MKISLKMKIISKIEKMKATSETKTNSKTNSKMNKNKNTKKENFILKSVPGPRLFF